jgi:hypothetical protein
VEEIKLGSSFSCTLAGALLKYSTTMLPEFDNNGNLPVGIHSASPEEIHARFGASSTRRKWLADRFQEIIETAKATGKLRRIFLWGSFVTVREEPNDLDVLLIMSDDFESSEVSGEAELLFDHLKAKMRFTTDLFWTKESMPPDILQMWLETYQITKDFERRGIVEVILS